MTLRSLVVLALALFLFLPTAEAQDPPVTRYVRGRHDEVLQRLRRPASADRTRQITEIIDGLLDFEELSRRSLGDHWGRMGVPQRTEFTDLLRQLVDRQYQSQLEHIGEAEVRYLGEETTSDGVLVHTEVRSRTDRRAEPMRIDYLMRSAGGGWRVIDVTTDGVSLVANYRRQFNRIITQHDIAELLTRMRSRLAEGTHSGTD
jgi:phospholipid transport system substrate-binding protein